MNPYEKLPAHKFWRTGVADKGVFNYENIWSSKWDLTKSTVFSTYGSCFAQHISRELSARKLNWLNAERAPGKTTAQIAAKFNYGVFSSRTGNIYTVKQLLTWCELARDLGKCKEVEHFEQLGRFYDSLRPAIEPNGFSSKEEMQASLASTAFAFKNSIVKTNVFVFTLGLTEGWENNETGQCYAMCPGTLVGTFDEEKHVFKNYSYPEINSDLESALKILRELNSEIKVLLTVSPVPLTATASDHHVLSATTYSKSVLRAIAGDFAQRYEDVDYFPSYELVASPPTRGAFFEPNLRSVARDGVNIVMRYFFAGLKLTADSKKSDERAALFAKETEKNAELRAETEQLMSSEDLVCEEMMLEKSNARK